MAGRIDLAIIGQTSQESDRVKTEALLDEDMLIVLPPQHPMAASPRIDLRSIAHETLIMFPRAIAPVLYDEVPASARNSGRRPRRLRRPSAWLPQASASPSSP